MVEDKGTSSAGFTGLSGSPNCATNWDVIDWDFAAPFGKTERSPAPWRKPNMEQVIEQRGRFCLLRTDSGFAWALTGEGGAQWYWHPETLQWTGRPHTSRTAELATVGLDLEGSQPDGLAQPPHRTPLCRLAPRRF